VLITLSLFGYLVLNVVTQGDVAVAGPIDGQWWRVATSPFLYGDVWYELTAVLAIGLYGWLLERRHGPFAVRVLFALCGMGGAALEVVLDATPVAIGGNGAALGLLCAWAVPDLLARARGEEYDGDLLGTLVIAIVVLLMPLATPEASPIAGFAGGAAGMLCGLGLARTLRA
jgi:membrane associated rhomboid family serine protease